MIGKKHVLSEFTLVGHAFFYISKIYSTFTCDFKNKNDTYYDKSKTTSVAV